MCIRDSFSRDGNGCQTLYGERQWMVCKSREHKLTTLFFSNVGNKALVNLKNDSIGIQRRQLEQNLASLDRSAKSLTEIASHDYSIEWCSDFGSSDLGIKKFYLSACLGDLGGIDLHLRCIARSQGIVILTSALFLLALPAFPLESYVAIIEGRQDLIFYDDITRSHRRRTDITLSLIHISEPTRLLS